MTGHQEIHAAMEANIADVLKSIQAIFALLEQLKKLQETAKSEPKK
jgi:hypothetical protein